MTVMMMMMMMMIVRLGRVQCLPRLDVDHAVIVVPKDEACLFRRLVLPVLGPLVILAQTVPSRGKVRMGRRLAMRFRRFDEFRVPRRIVSAISKMEKDANNDFVRSFFFSIYLDMYRKGIPGL